MALIVLGLACFSGPAVATLWVLPVTGGPGIDQGEICVHGSTCPGTPSWTVSGNTGVLNNGLEFSYNDATGWAGPLFQTLGPVNFTPTGPQLGPGIFDALTIPMTQTPLPGGGFKITQSAPELGGSSAPTNWTQLVSVSSSPVVTQFTCTVGTGSDHCSGWFGPGGSSSSATSTWEVKDSAGLLYDVALHFDVDVLPEPSTIVMVSVGVLGLVIGRRRLIM